MDGRLTEWEAAVFEALASVDGTGRLARSTPHLLVSSRCDCCNTFDLRDGRIPLADLGVAPFSEGASRDGAWEFVLWTDDAGDPYCVEEVSNTSGEPPPPSTLLTRRLAELRPI